MHEIRSFKIFQTAKAMGALFAVLFAISITILMAFAFAVSRSHPEAKMPPSIFFLFPIIAGVYFFLVTALVCWVYNLVAAQIGGIAFELTPRSEN
jgi:hypothetical protein